MRKILIIAWREYRAMVGTRAFLISMAVMPLLMLGVICIPAMLQGLQVPAVRTIAVIDQTGGLLPLLQLAADRRNQQLSAARDGQSAASHDGLTAMLGLQDQSLYEFRAHPAGDFGDDDRLLLSQQIRAGKLHAFVEIPINASLTWVSEDPGMSDVRRWCEQTIDSVQRQQRLADCVPAGLLPVVTVALSQSTELQSQGLSFLDSTGQIQREPVQSSLSSIAVPIGIAGMMFVAVLLSVQPMLESVLEEKLLRISEVLLGSASATQLMTGKLAGNAAGAMTIFGLYGAGAICVAWLQGFAESVPWALLPWLLFLQLLAQPPHVGHAATPQPELALQHKQQDDQHDVQGAQHRRHAWRLTQVVESRTAGVLRDVAQVFLDAQQLVVLGQSVRTTHRPCFNLTRIGTCCNVSDRTIFGFTRAMRDYCRVISAFSHLNCSKGLGESTNLINLDQD